MNKTLKVSAPIWVGLSLTIAAMLVGAAFAALTFSIIAPRDVVTAVVHADLDGCYADLDSCEQKLRACRK